MSVSDEFIFKKTSNGELEFVGDFDAYYQSEEDPWGQSGSEPRMQEYYKMSRARTRGLLANLSPKSVVVVGCGTGHTMHEIKNTVPCKLVGMDVSEHALERARQLFPGFEYHVGNILRQKTLKVVENEQFDVVIFEQILWYILEGLDAALTNAASLLAPGGHLVVSNAFVREQKYGTAVVNGYPGAASRFSIDPHYTLVHSSYHDDGLLHTDGHFVLQRS